jgi:hypothetical protein
MQIRIQYISTEPEPDWIQFQFLGFDDQKLKILQLNKNPFFLN